MTTTHPWPHLFHEGAADTPVLLLLLRWQTPLGTFTVMAGSVALALAARTGLGLAGLAGAAVLGGTAADVAVALLRPSPQRRWAARAVAVIAPAVYWTAHFGLLTVGYGAGWEPALAECARCGRPGPHRAFSVPAGGAVCADCRPAGSATPDEASIALVVALLSGDWDTVGRTDERHLREASRLVAGYVSWHLERGLTSLSHVAR